MKFKRIWTETTHYCEDESGGVYRRDSNGKWGYEVADGVFEAEYNEEKKLEAAFIDGLSIVDCPQPPSSTPDQQE